MPPLENGDRLSRAEFERRYEAMPHVHKAELIEGVVHMPSPVRLDNHAQPQLDLLTVLGTYRQMTPGVEGGDNATVKLDMKNEPQPDGVLFIAPERGGSVKIDADGYIVGAPELGAEIAASSVSIDLGPKFEAYQRNGVQEYLVWRVLDKAIDWFSLRRKKYERLPVDAEGVVKSKVFPGLWLAPAALIHKDFRRLHQVLNAGLASPEHQAFVSRLGKS